jgi:hypothetical protein
MALAVMAVAAAWPAAARAGSYHVEVCRNVFTGATAPADGVTFHTQGSYVYAGASCTGLTGAFAAMDGGLAHPFGDDATWAFTAPPGATIGAFTLYRYLYAGASQPYGTPVASVDEWTGPRATGSATGVASCAATTACTSQGDPWNPLAAGNAISQSGLTGVESLAGHATCGGGAGGSCPAGGAPCAEAGAHCSALSRLLGLDVTLVDSAPPQASNLTGPLVGSGELAGVEDIAFDATDSGGGVYSQTTTLDGGVVSSGPVDTNGGRCQDLGGPTDGTHAFYYVVPCRPSVSVDIPLDTTTLKDGSHALKVVVQDAAGNVATVYSGSITTRNAPQGGLPEINGTAQQGQTLSVTPGSWSPTPSAFAYRWLRCDATGVGCAPIAGATSQTYAVLPADAYHQLAVEVTAGDASGSTTTRSPMSGVIADSRGNTSAPPSPPAPANATFISATFNPSVHIANGAGACGAAHLALHFGAGPVAHVRLGQGATLHGVLDCAGRAISGAKLEMTVAPAAARAAALSGELQTAQDGSFAYVLAAGASRQVSISYRAYSDDVALAATAQAELRVKSSVSLRVSPSRSHNGGTVTYRGRVLGGYLPARGLPLSVQYRDGRRWRTFDQVRARQRDGRFTYQYRFRRTTAPTTYRFRVTIPATGVTGYPYDPAASPARAVRVTP